MARKLGGMRLAAAAAFLGAAGFGLDGCMKAAAVPAEQSKVERRTATPKQLLGMLLDQMNHIGTLAAETKFSIAVQTVLVPATMPDYILMESGKSYRKKFLQTEVEGRLLLSRSPRGKLDIRVSGLIGGLDSFMLLGKNDSFWIMQPTSQHERDEYIREGRAAPRATVTYGKLQPEAIAPEGELSVRPQDIAGLLLDDEAYPALQGPDICSVETWPDYYIISFWRQNWPQHIYSKYWIERRQLTVAIHQLFDGDGRLVAEGRFKDYALYSAGKDNSVSIQLPTRVEIIWPLDKIVLDATLSNVHVNEAIEDRFFDEHVLDIYPATPLQPMPAPAAPAQPPD